MTKGVTVWFTGLSGSGKTTIAKRIETILQDRGVPVERLDGDIVRQSLTRDLGFSKEDRDKNIERVTFVSKLLTRNGVVTLCAFISPYKNIRDQSRREIGEFLEVYVKASLDALLERDLKGLYRKALAGEIQNFTGVNDPYDAPENPELVCDTDVESIEESTEKVLSMLEERGYIPSDGSAKRRGAAPRPATEKVAGPSTPHGGTLVNRELAADERADALSRAKSLYSVALGDRELADVEMIGIGAMSPLTGFMRQLDYQTVVDSMRLSDGLIWPLPVTLAVTAEQAAKIGDGAEISLRRQWEASCPDACDRALQIRQGARGGARFRNQRQGSSRRRSHLRPGRHACSRTSLGDRPSESGNVRRVPPDASADAADIRRARLEIRRRVSNAKSGAPRA